jgi:tetratricopeptide (TPR) repeat protein
MIKNEQGAAGCLAVYEQALKIAEKIGDRSGASICAISLGHAFMEIPALRDLSKAEEWYRRSLDLLPANDRMGQGQRMHQLGMVERKRPGEAIEAKSSPEELLGHFSAAVGWFEKALRLVPPEARANINNELGGIYGDVGDLDSALPYYREGIRCDEAQENRRRAGNTRSNVAVDLANARRFPEALEWARAALRDFEAVENADDRIIRTTELIRQIESGLSKTPPQP